MVPCRLTGKAFWDIYLYQDPPLWKAHLDALKYFDIDGGFELYDFGPIDVVDNCPPGWEERIVFKDTDSDRARIVTQQFFPETETWSPYVTVYTRENPPGTFVKPSTLGLPDEPTEWEPIIGIKAWPTGLERWLLIRQELGDQGILGLNSGMGTALLETPEDVYAYYDNPDSWKRKALAMLERVERRMEKIAQMNPRPDFLFCGGSGTLVFQSPKIFRELMLPVLKRTTELAYDLGIPTHVHSCGPEKKLVEMAALETKLTIIDPLEVPPMGDCNLRELKQRFGDKIILKGNLHTTEVMLRGSVDDVIAASRQAIDDAGQGGGFILSTGDQCGRDTPDENIRAMVETARTYGKY
jgi:uroporphyrinogen decarboxylase